MATNPIRDNRRILAASVVGTAVEYYDFYLYGYAAALVLGPLFFPAESPAAQTLAALMSFALAFFARPLGAIAFGHFGDRVGRKSTLVASLLTMGVCTVLIAFLPTYATAGWAAPVLLCLLRFGQGFGLGGEWAGAALLSIENAPKGWCARFGSMPPLGAALGNVAAMAMFLVIGLTVSDEDFLAWGWRLPFLASVVLIAIGLWVRLRIGETPEFRAALEREPPPRVPLAELFRHHAGAVVIGCAGVICAFALVYMVGPFTLAIATAGPTGHSRQAVLLVQLVAQVVAIPVVLLAAGHADRAGLNRTFASGALATAAVGTLFGPALASGSLYLIGVAVLAANLAWAVLSSSLSTWLCRLYPVHVRYSGFAFAFNTGGIIGALMPIPAQMIATAGGLQYVGLLLTVAALVTFAAVKVSRPAEEGGPLAQPA